MPSYKMCGQRLFEYTGVQEWNKLSLGINSLTNSVGFNFKVKILFLERIFLIDIIELCF